MRSMCDCIHARSLRLMLNLLFGCDGMNETGGGSVDKYSMYLFVVVFRSFVATYSAWNTQQLDCIHVGSLRLMLHLLFGYNGMNGTGGGNVNLYSRYLRVVMLRSFEYSLCTCVL